MRNAALTLLAGVLLAGCVSRPSRTVETIQGTWQFACVGKTHSRFGQMPPPRFDLITFRAPNIVNLTSTLTRQEFSGTFELSGKHLSYEFLAPGIDHTITHELTIETADQGRTLLLTHDQTQMVYYRPSHFLPNDLAGEWTTGSGKQTETMRLGKNGSYQLVKSRTTGYYSLWASPYGKTMTTVFSMPQHGGFLMLWTCDLYGDDLTLTPISWTGPKTNEAVTWTRRKPNSKRPRPTTPRE
jgi:hypothetical protein